jgi:hypothetical protein
MKKIFLLGGYDLEMIEIKKLLQQNGQKFFDKKLSWGAKLSDYKEYFNDKDEFIAIELEEDTTSPKYFEVIDHHGKFSYKQSALEQLAKMLDIELTRWQKLVAVNDSRYISGLRDFGATKQEIEEIRYADRKVQGITQKDEELAIESISNAKNKHIIYAKTPHFSAVSDRVYNDFTQYIIYNEYKIIFYGFSIKNLLLYLNKKQISSKNYYYGGGEGGFLGIKESLLSSEEIIKLLEDFK